MLVDKAGQWSDSGPIKNNQNILSMQCNGSAGFSCPFFKEKNLEQWAMMNKICNLVFGVFVETRHHPHFLCMLKVNKKATDIARSPQVFQPIAMKINSANLCFDCSQHWWINKCLATGQPPCDEAISDKAVEIKLNAWLFAWFFELAFLWWRWMMRIHARYSVLMLVTLLLDLMMATWGDNVWFFEKFCHDDDE